MKTQYWTDFFFNQINLISSGLFLACPSCRCGAGTNNVPVARMTELGIPVFNTPGANANAVKELVICGMLLGSRRIVDGVNHMKKLGNEGLAKERVEKDKAMFGGQEITGKTLAVIGLGKHPWASQRAPLYIFLFFCVG